MKTNNIAEMKRQDVIEALRPHVPAQRFREILYYSTERLKATLFYFEIGGGAEELRVRKQFDPAFALILSMIGNVRQTGRKYTHVTALAPIRKGELVSIVPMRKLKVKSVTELAHG